MNKTSTGTRSIMLKAVCTAMALILGGSLFAAGVMGSDGCGMKCCCQTGPTHMQASAEKQMRAPMGCCSGVPLSPCDLQSAKPFELPEIILSSCCNDLSYPGGASVILTETSDKSHNSGGKFIVQVLDPKFNSPPLYLQNLSFLI
ncbi:hypothetical protein D1BOALGB6SA_4105 [Olavius sp. associated proteobacterium Delta 1]|nr:hypothetical protein D1BOALGB6SA_4105 [Olavius sp. associated proteobacterium Delta 1]